jgi:CRP-like cAMP-binding protein
MASLKKNDEARLKPLEKFTRKFHAGQFLFHEGEGATNAFLIVEGTVSLLVDVESGHPRSLETLSRGDILGERVLFCREPYSHLLGAKAMSAVTALEFNSQDLGKVLAIFPDLPARMVSTVCERLSKANSLIRILQIEDNADRILQYMVLHAKINAKGVGAISQVPHCTAEMAIAMRLPPALVENALTFLRDKGLLKYEKSCYFLTDDTDIIRHAVSLRKFLAGETKR